MFQDNPLLQQLKTQIRENIPKQEGTIKATERGFGFLETDNGDSVFIPPPYMKKVLHGDRVVALIRDEKERQVAEPANLLQPALDRFIARVAFHRERMTVVPDHPMIRQSLRARPLAGLKGVNWQEGDWVVARLQRHPLREDHFFAEIEQRISATDDKFVPWHVSLQRHALPAEAPTADTPLDLLDAQVTRQDLTALPFFTMDSASTRDMDDALHITRSGSGWELTVAIADPTAYIEQNSPLDQEAAKRGFTVYLPGRNIPMLPRELADELCSLHPAQRRPALCCRLRISDTGELEQTFEFFNAWISSSAKLAYNQVSDYLEQKSEWQPASELESQLHQLHDLTQARIAWRKANQVMFADQPDFSFELGDQGEVVAIHRHERRIGHRMVEEAMIAANICAGEFLSDAPGHGIFNVHPGFNTEQFDAVETILAESGLVYDRNQLQTLAGFSALRRELEQQPTRYLDQRLRRYQAFGEMSSTPEEHFGLGLPRYATWTSPLRKYGDLINHRLIKARLQAQEASTELTTELTDHLGECRRRNRRVERDVADWLYARYFNRKERRQAPLTAEVFDINRGGMRVRLKETGAMAFVPAGRILKERKRLKCCAETGIIYVDQTAQLRLGDEVQVNLFEVNEETRTLLAQPMKARD